MSQVNPYQAPQVDRAAPPQVPREPAHGIWSDGKHLIITKSATLPAVCVVTNEKPERSITRSFHWHHPAIYLAVLAGILIFVILALVLRKSHKLDIPLSRAALQKRKSALLMCWGFAGFFIVMIAVSFYLLATKALGVNSPGVGVLLLVLGFLGMLISAIVGGRYASILKPKKITDNASWFRGVSKDYLAMLPKLPPDFE